MTPDMQQPNQEETYDEQADAFAEQAPKLMTWEYIGKPALNKHINFKPNLRILDQGSASGRLEENFIEQGVNPSCITGIELSNEQVKIARERFPDVRFRQGDIRAMIPIQEVGTFDLVVSHMVYEFIDDEGLAMTLKNAYDALEEGGELLYIVTHPHKMALKRGTAEKGWFKTDAPWGGEVDNWQRSVMDFVGATIDAGFTIDIVENLGIPDEARDMNPEQWQKYKDYGVMRLLVKAHK